MELCSWMKTSVCTQRSSQTQVSRMAAPNCGDCLSLTQNFINSWEKPLYSFCVKQCAKKPPEVKSSPGWDSTSCYIWRVSVRDQVFRGQTKTLVNRRELIRLWCNEGSSFRIINICEGLVCSAHHTHTLTSWFLFSIVFFFLPLNNISSIVPSFLHRHKYFHRPSL